jgi:hypothetical protein
MIPKPVAFFTSDLPNDFVIEARDIVQMGGRNVAEEIRAMLEKLGCQTSSLIDGKPKGWGFTIAFEGEGFWCHVKSYYPAYYLVFVRSSPAEIALGSDPVYAKLWRSLSLALGEDSRFHDVEWHHSLHEAPPRPDAWFGWELGARKRPGFLARNVARPLGWLSLGLAVVVFLDFVTPSPLTAVGYLILSGVLLSIGYKVSHLFGVRLPWVRLP